MRLSPKLTLGMLAATAIPLAIAGAVTTRLSQNALRDRIQRDHAALAGGAADSVRRFLGEISSALAVYPQLVDLSGSSPEVITGALRLIYRTDDDVAAVALVDDKGRERVGAVYVSDEKTATELGHVRVSDAEHDELLKRLPLAAALAPGAEWAFGEVWLAGESHEPSCVIARAFTVRGTRLVLAVDLSFARLGRQLAEMSAGGADVVLVDAQRRAVAGGAWGARRLEPVALPDAPGVATVKEKGAPTSLVAYAPVAGTTFAVAVTQPEQVAFAHVRDLRNRTIFWILVAAAVALVVGLGLARDVSGRVGKLAAGTVKLTAGRLDGRLDERGGDEVADLARSFNQMAEEITRKNDEIMRWNAELEQRVAEKTRELEKAQDLVLRQRSLAAVGTLGAGVAHEINNPLTGVLGATQILLMELPEDGRVRPLLKDVESQAQRIRDIVANLLRVAQRETGDELLPLDLNRVVDDAMNLISAEELRRGRIELERLTAEVPAMRGNPVLLQEALIELVTNARRAMPEGGRLTITTSAPDRRLVKLEVRDTGKGIAPEVIDKIFDPFFTTKDKWEATGMGLTLVHKIVTEHKGSIAVDSRVGAGATFTLTFPSDPARAHLD